MNEVYVQETGEAIAGIAYVSKPFDVGGINVSILNRIQTVKGYEGQGMGQKLLSQVLDDADKGGVMLMLSVDPDRPDDEEWIRNWYIRNGFEPWEDCLARLPQEKGPQ